MGKVIEMGMGMRMRMGIGKGMGMGLDAQRRGIVMLKRKVGKT